jgi:glycosyltransferase involved in cell wall biosynthesis
MTEQVKVSIVIPVYNVEEFLAECIESILNQSFKEYEAIFVNDGSQDKSGEILKEYQKKDKRIKIIEQENKGQSAARNAGIKQASGQYLIFIDSDDYIGREYVKDLLEEAVKQEADMVVCGYTKVDVKGNVLYEYIIDGIREIREEIIPLTYISWNRIIKRTLMTDNQLFYWEGVQGEDIPVILILESLARKVCYVRSTEYYYRTNSNSTTAFFKKKGIAREKIPFQALEEGIKFSLKHRDRFTFEQLEYYVCRILTTFIFDVGKKSEISVVLELCTYARRILSECFPQYYRNKYVKLNKLKSFPLSHRLGVWLFVKLMRTRCLKAFAVVYTRF